MNLSPFSFVRQSIPSFCQAAKRCLHQWTKRDSHGLVPKAALDLTHSKPELVLENVLLRHQFIVLKREVRRPASTGRDLVLFVPLASKLRTWKQALVIV